MKYPAGGRGDVLLAQPVGRHCSGDREDSGSGLHLQLFDGMAAVSMVITAAVRNLFRFKKGPAFGMVKKCLWVFDL